MAAPQSTELTAKPDAGAKPLAADSASPATASNGNDERAAGGSVESSNKPGIGGKLVGLGLLLVVLIVGGIWGIHYWQYSSVHVSTDDAYVTSDVVQITPQEAGSIVEIPVLENQHVKKGDLLARLDDATYQADLEQAKANLANARATVAASDLNVGLTQATGNAQVQQAQGGVALTERAIGGAQADVQRIAATIQSAQSQVKGAQDSIKSAQAAADAAVATRDRFVAAVRGAQAQITTAEAAVRTAQANVAQAQANYDKANKDAVRYATLYDQDAISAQTLDTANATAKSARAQVDSLQRQIEQAQSTVEARRADLTAAQEQVRAADATIQQTRAQVSAAREAVNAANANVRQNQAQLQANREAVGQQIARREQALGVLNQAKTAPKQVAVSQASVNTNRTKIIQAEAALKNAQIALNRTRLVAPYDGIISKKTGEIGQQVAIGQQVMSLIPERDIWVVANFKETQLKKVVPGQDVEIEVDALNGEKFKGRVESISAGTGSTFALLPSDNATGNFTKVVQRVPIKILFDKDQKGLDQLRAGLSVVASITTGK